jgi:MoaA/NifB/PqqE/SkfB family radical SAM enzyme
MEKIDGISILVGTARCNARCPDCAGRQHRKNAPAADGEINEKRLREVLDHCLERNCRYITLTGSGEPTLSPLAVTRTLAVLRQYALSGRPFSPVNLYTNGIRLGSDPVFCARFLPLWKKLGLTSVYVSVYSAEEKKNARAFGIAAYPRLADIFRAVKDRGFILRTSIILKKGYTDSAEAFRALCEKFFSLGVDDISAWPLKDKDDFISSLAPGRDELGKIRDLAADQHHHFPAYPQRKIRLLLGDQNAKENLGKKIALFQDGTISDVWCARK